MQDSVLIDVSKVSVTLRHTGLCHEVLHELDFCLRRGEHVVIVGANGAGKSTFLRLLRGEVWASSGQIYWNCKGQKESSPIMGRSMTSLVSSAKQEAYVRFEWRLNGEDILLTAFSDSELLHFIPDAEQKKAVQNMAERLKVTHLLHQEACTLSQGQLRILLLGRALLQKAPVLLLDEFLDGLDVGKRNEIMNILKDCECTIVLTAHRDNSIPAWIKHRFSMQNGRLQKYALTDSSSIVQKHVPKQAIASPSTGADSIHTFIDIQNATVFIKRKPILHDISFQWRKGEHWFIAGENGSGKSTFLRLVGGEEFPAFDGGNVRRSFLKYGENAKERAVFGRAIGLLSDNKQQTYGYDVTGLELVLSGLDQVEGVYREYSEQECVKALALMQSFALQSLETRRIRSLSTGQLRRLLFARLMLGEPELVLLDEPFSGLDQASTWQIRDLFEAQVEHVHFMLVSHYAEDLLECINRQASMHLGRLTIR